MSYFSVFKYLDKSIIDDESSVARASRTPAVWPSEASAVRVDKTYFNIIGTCMRKQVYRMIGWQRVIEAEAGGPWTWVVGRAVEDKLTDLARYQSQSAGIDDIYLANGVRLFISELYLPLEMDVIVEDPETKRAWILECKTYAGYYAERQIEKDRKPKDENLIQACLYLLETQTGKKLKDLIRKSMAERAVLDASGRTHRNRCEANLERLETVDDGPVGCKLVYINRGTLARTEMDIEIYEDADGYHYPMVDGVPYKLFTIESIYERFRTAQNYWFRMRQEAVDRLAKKGIKPPPTVKLILSRDDISESYVDALPLSDVDQAMENKYYQLLEDEVRSLPEEFFPPPEYEWSYSPERIAELAEGKIISATKMKDYKSKTKKGEFVRMGDWQCNPRYCAYAKAGCIAKQKPDLAYQAYDFAQMDEETEVKIGE